MAFAAPLVMIVDDDPDFLDICRHVLEAGGYRVVGISDPADALKLMEKEKPRLVVTDLMMKTLDSGFLFARQIKEDPRYKDVPVILITGVSRQRAFDFTPRTPADLTAMRADAFLSKPITPDALLAKVRELLVKRPTSSS